VYNSNRLTKPQQDPAVGSVTYLLKGSAGGAE